MQNVNRNSEGVMIPNKQENSKPVGFKQLFQEQQMDTSRPRTEKKSLSRILGFKSKDDENADKKRGSFDRITEKFLSHSGSKSNSTSALDRRYSQTSPMTFNLRSPSSSAKAADSPKSDSSKLDPNEPPDSPNRDNNTPFPGFSRSISANSKPHAFSNMQISANKKQSFKSSLNTSEAALRRKNARSNQKHALNPSNNVDKTKSLASGLIREKNRNSAFERLSFRPDVNEISKNLGQFFPDIHLLKVTKSDVTENDLDVLFIERLPQKTGESLGSPNSPNDQASRSTAFQRIAQKAIAINRLQKGRIKSSLFITNSTTPNESLNRGSLIASTLSTCQSSNSEKSSENNANEQRLSGDIKTNNCNQLDPISEEHNIPPTLKTSETVQKISKVWPTPGNEDIRNNLISKAMTSNPSNLVSLYKGDRIGRGAFGEVYLALNLHTWELIAVKEVDTMQLQKKLKKGKSSEIKHEMEILQELSHPNIVAYLGFEQVGEVTRLFMEYVSGGSVGHTLINTGPFPPELTQCVTAQVLMGLDYLHCQKGIIQRDIKADNILISLECQVKISDFGISIKLDEKDVYRSDKKRSVNMGTINFMAPETFGKDGYSAKVDIWSLGCTIIEMATGLKPWHRMVYMDIVQKMKNRQIPELDSISSESIRSFVVKCLDFNPEKRPSAKELLADQFITSCTDPCGYPFASFVQNATNLKKQQQSMNEESSDESSNESSA